MGSGIKPLWRRPHGRRSWRIWIHIYSAPRIHSHNILRLSPFLSVNGGAAEDGITGVDEMVGEGGPEFCGITGGRGGGGGRKSTGDIRV